VGRAFTRSDVATTGQVTPADRVRAIKPMTWEQRTLLLDAAMHEPRWGAFFATLAKASLRPG